MTQGLIARKLGMTSAFDDKGNHCGVTILEVPPNVVIDKVLDKDGNIVRVRLGCGEKKLKNTTKPMRAIFARAKTTPKEKIAEFVTLVPNIELGQIIKIEDVFKEGERIKVVGISKGKGFQGVVKRHGFGGVGARTHGQHNRERAPGSVGSTTFPARVWKGKRMAGRMGGNKITIHNVQIFKILSDKNIILVKGGVPGYKKSYVKLIKY